MRMFIPLGNLTGFPEKKSLNCSFYQFHIRAIPSNKIANFEIELTDNKNKF